MTRQESGVSYGLGGFFFTDANTGTIAGSYGTMLRTTDGGKHRVYQRNWASNAFSAVFFINDKTGIAAGTKGMIMRTVNGGTVSVDETDRQDLYQSIPAQNYPNPANESATIGYTVAKAGAVFIEMLWATGSLSS